MPKLKAGEVGIDVDSLEDAEYNEDGDFADYEGDLPPAGTIVPGCIKKMWLTTTREKPDGTGGDRMIKVLFVGDDNADEYEGLPIWDNLALLPATKWRWQPLFNVIGITLREVATKMYVAAEDDRFGAPIEKIGNWRPGEENDEAYLAVVTKNGRDLDGNLRADVKKWLPYPEDLDEEEPDADEDEEELDDEVDADDDEEVETDEEDEDEPEPEPAPRRAAGRRTAAAPARTASKPATRASAKSAPAKNQPAKGRSQASKPTNTRSGRAASAPATTATRGTRSGRTRSAASSDEPPF